MRSEVRRFGIVFLDDLDKLEGENRTDWSRSILTSLYNLLDGRLDSHEEDCRLLNTQVPCVGAGTWQRLQRKAIRGASNVASCGARLEQIEAESEIPEELLFRFNANTIYIDAPLEREIQERIADIHRDLGTAAPCASKIAKLATRAAASNRQEIPHGGLRTRPGGCRTRDRT